MSLQDIKDTDWLLLVEDDGTDGLGRVLGYVVGPNELSLSNLPRGEVFDSLELFMDGEVPDDVCVEVIQVEDFYESYGNRMPLSGNSFSINY